ncbi:hypothetical protein GCM10023334_063000 [Nonomuraea thailandensis]
MRQDARRVPQPRPGRPAGPPLTHGRPPEGPEATEALQALKSPERAAQPACPAAWRPGTRRNQLAWLTVDMLKSGTRTAGMMVRWK